MSPTSANNLTMFLHRIIPYLLYLFIYLFIFQHKQQCKLITNNPIVSTHKQLEQKLNIQRCHQVHVNPVQSRPSKRHSPSEL